MANILHTTIFVIFIFVFADALHHAARDGEDELVTQLLDSKVVDINHKESDGVRPLLPPLPPLRASPNLETRFVGRSCFSLADSEKK